MSEPSKEAYARADAALPPSSRRSEWQRQSVATALQELMDERDAQLQARAELLTYYDAMKQRAEAAEAKLAECVRRVREWTELWNDGATTVSGLCAILDDYEPKTEEPGR